MLNENIELYIFLSTSITRVGAVLLLIFGAQILISFYRYNLRLAAFYDARADAIELLADGPIDDLRPLVTSLSADQIDVGRVPKPVAQEIIELSEAIATIRKR